MRYLRAIAEDFGLAALVEEATRDPAVQGVVLDLDPWWLLFREMDRAHPGALSHLDWSGAAGYARLGSGPPGRAGDAAIEEMDLRWRPDFWDEWCAAVRGASDDDLPLLVVIALRPGSRPEPKRLPRTRLSVRWETRPIARLAGNPKAYRRPLIGGVSVGEKGHSSGTLGGTLRDRGSGKAYGLTCAHVLQMAANASQPSPSDSHKSAHIGYVLEHSSPRAGQNVHVCNPYASNAVVNTIDAALVEVDPNVATLPEVLDIGPIGAMTPRNRLYPGLHAEITGRSSGNRLLKIGGLAVCYQFVDQGGKLYCYRDLFELRNRCRFGMRRPIRGGDSGAWVTVQGAQGTQWCGMVLGEDRLQGYAMFAEDLDDWLAKRGYRLDCS